MKLTAQILFLFFCILRRATAVVPSWHANRVDVADVTMIMPSDSGWILFRIMEEIASAVRQKTKNIQYINFEDVGSKNIDPSRVFVFSHPLDFFAFLAKQPAKAIFAKRLFVYYTHYEPKKLLNFVEWQFFILAKIGKIDLLLMNNASIEKLPTALQPKSFLVMAGCDVMTQKAKLSSMLPEKKTSKRTVGLVGRYYPRKNLELLVRICNELPNVEFQIFGTGWEASDMFKAISLCPNFTILNFELDKLHEFYMRLDCFLSLSKLEGGPIPMLEAASLGIPIFCFETGFASELKGDLAEHICILPLDTPDSTVPERLSEFLNAQKGVEKAQHVDYSWQRFHSTVNNAICWK